MSEIPSKVIAEQHEAYRHLCPVCEHRPYKTASSWWGHIEKEHKGTYKTLVANIKRAGDAE